ncbi:MAG: hypothetical protein WCD18_09875 [Thermosynechococcaceae cyanobacterium]
MPKLLIATTALSVIVFHAVATRAAELTTLWDTLQPNNTIAFSSQGQVPDEAADDFTITNKKDFRVQNVSFLSIFTKENAKIKDITAVFSRVTYKPS